MTREEKEKALLAKVENWSGGIQLGGKGAEYSMPGLDSLVHNIADCGLLSEMQRHELAEMVRNFEFGRITAALAIMAMLGGDTKEIEETARQFDMIATKTEVFAIGLRAYVKVSDPRREGREPESDLH